MIDIPTTIVYSKRICILVAFTFNALMIIGFGLNEAMVSLSPLSIYESEDAHVTIYFTFRSYFIKLSDEYQKMLEGTPFEQKDESLAIRSIDEYLYDNACEKSEDGSGTVFGVAFGLSIVSFMCMLSFICLGNSFTMDGLTIAFSILAAVSGLSALETWRECGELTEEFGEWVTSGTTYMDMDVSKATFTMMGGGSIFIVMGFVFHLCASLLAWAEWYNIHYNSRDMAESQSVDVKLEI